ncbi:MAG: DUF1573 domain-containing protein [Planctomycetota bacterium]
MKAIPTPVLALAVVLLGGLFVLSRMDAGPSETQAALRTEIGSHDFGFIDQGEIVRHTFRTENTTGETWTVRRATVSCGCVEVESVSETVAPGETLELVARLSSKGRRGPLDQSVNVLVEPGPVLLRAQLAASVIGDPYATPAVLDVTIGPDDTMFEAAATVRGLLEGATVGIEAHLTSSALDVELGDPQPDQRFFQVEATLRGEVPLGVDEAGFLLALRADGPRPVTPLNVAVKVRRDRHLVASPSVLFLSADAEAGDVSASIHVQRLDRVALSELSFHVDPPEAAEVRLVGEGELRLRTAAGAERQPFTVRIDGGGESLAVPARWVSLPD